MSGKRVQFVAAAALSAAAVVTLTHAASRADEGPSGDDVLDGPEVRELLAILESETFRAMDYEALRTEAVARFVRVVAKGGDGLRDAALRRMRAQRGDERRRAELVLAQVKEMPASALRPLLDDDDVEVSTWAYLVLRSSCKGLDAPASREVATDASAATDGVPPARDPILDVHAGIRAAVGDFEMVNGAAVTRRDHEEDEVWSIDLDRRTLDLDGDGVAEHCVVASLSPSLQFAAVLRRPDETAGWEIAAIGRSEFACDPEPVIADFDGDGAPDFGVAYNNHGIPTYGGFLAYSPKDRTFVEAPWSYHSAVLILRRRKDEAPVFASRESYKGDEGCGAARDVGACAMEHKLSRWNGRAFESIGSVWTND